MVLRNRMDGWSHLNERWITKRSYIYPRHFFM